MQDKDGVAAAAVFAEMAAHLYSQGTTLLDHLQHLYRLYGYYDYRAGYFIADPPSRSQLVFDSLRGGSASALGAQQQQQQQPSYPEAISGYRVLSVRDMGLGIDTSQPTGRPALPHSPADMMITFAMESDATLTFRASGTEPKLKYYLDVAAVDMQAATKVADAIEAAIESELVRPSEHGLTSRPSV